MDAILGRDDRLVEKIGKACEKLSADFIAVIGTPVPAVIGTDYRALSRMIEKKTGIPALTIDTDGTKLYDDGEKKTWKELFKKFAVEKDVEPGRIGIYDGRIKTNSSLVTDKMNSYVILELSGQPLLNLAVFMKKIS